MLVACKRCNRHISERDDVCPFCKQRSTLGRVGAAALSASVLLSGCDQGVKKPETPAVEKPTWAKVRGGVKDQQGKTLSGATVSIWRTDLPYEQVVSKSAKTDSSGLFSFDRLDAGKYAISVSHHSYEGPRQVGMAQRDLILAAGDDKKEDFILVMEHMEVAPPYGAPPARRRIV